MWLFEYYIYPSLLLAVMVAGQGLCAYLAYCKACSLAKLTAHSRLVPYVDKGYVRAMKASNLVPGDIIVVVPGPAVCDMVLLRGNCLVEESALSGEASPRLLQHDCAAQHGASCRIATIASPSFAA